MEQVARRRFAETSRGRWRDTAPMKSSGVYGKIRKREFPRAIGEIGAARRIFRGELSLLARVVDPNELSVLISLHRFNVWAFDIFSENLYD